MHTHTRAPHEIQTIIILHTFCKNTSHTETEIKNLRDFCSSIRVRVVVLIWDKKKEREREEKRKMCRITSPADRARALNKYRTQILKMLVGIRQRVDRIHHSTGRPSYRISILVIFIKTIIINDRRATHLNKAICFQFLVSRCPWIAFCRSLSLCVRVRWD